MNSRDGRILLILIAPIVAVNAFVFPTVARLMGESAGGSFLPLDLRLLYSADEAYAALASLGAGGRKLYLMVELTVDMIYPLAYGFFLFLLARRLLAKVDPVPRWAERAALLPFAAMTLDWIENGFVVALIARYPARMDAMAAAASAITATKMLCFALSVALLLFAAGRWWFSRRRRRRRRAPAPT